MRQFPIHQLNLFLARYPGLEELIEEFEHLSLAREDEDEDAIAYFKQQRAFREESALQNRDIKDDSSDEQQIIPSMA